MAFLNFDTTTTAWFVGIAEATGTIILTSLEDCVWLVPFVAHASSRHTALCHGVTFVITFVGLACLTCGAAVLLKEGLSQFLESNNVMFESIGALLCWIIAGLLWYRTYRKRQQQRQQQHSTITDGEEEAVPPLSISIQEGDEVTTDSRLTGYGSLADSRKQQQQQPQQQRFLENQPSSLSLFEEVEGAALRTEASYYSWRPTTARDHTSSASTLAVIVSLTVVGSLDEMLYFPGLIVGGLFTAQQLVLGSLLAALVILLLVEVMVQRCTGCLSLLDQIPLYAVVIMFAMILTLQVLLDVVPF